MRYFKEFLKRMAVPKMTNEEIEYFILKKM